MSYKVFFYIALISLLGLSCKKKENRTCYKGSGDESARTIDLDSVAKFKLYKNLKYSIYQDTGRFVKIIGGENLINLVEVENEDGELRIENKNKCDFFRKYSAQIEVEIHYPYYAEFYIEPSDSVIFVDTVKSENLIVEYRDGGGSSVINVDAGFFSVVVSNGTTDYTLGGFADQAEVKVQNNGFADARNFTANALFVYQNSTADMRVNVDSAHALIIIDGTGDVIYRGNADETEFGGIGSGRFKTE